MMKGDLLMSTSPYQVCPVFESDHLIYRLVQEDDAKDLLACYSDPASILLFNSDNCHNDFNFQTLEEMSKCIRFWLDEYEQQGYVRFSLVEKTSDKAVGTIEFFAREGSVEGLGEVGILRLDLVSRLETEAFITEILTMVNDELYDCFGVHTVITKAIPRADQRVIALMNRGYQKIDNSSILPFDDYYFRARA